MLTSVSLLIFTASPKAPVCSFKGIHCAKEVVGTYIRLVYAVQCMCTICALRVNCLQRVRVLHMCVCIFARTRVCARGCVCVSARMRMYACQCVCACL